MSNPEKPSNGAITANPEFTESKFKTLRVWPLVLLVVIFVSSLLLRLLESGSTLVQTLTVLGPASCGPLVMVWWLTFSRARWQERLLGLIGFLGAFGVAFLLLDKTMKGGPTIVVTIPMGTAAFTAGVLLCRNMLSFQRTVVAVTLAAVGFGASTLLRGEGMWGNAAIGLEWRFRPSAEERLVAEKAVKSAVTTEAGRLTRFDPAAVDQWLTNPEWPAFRGRQRMGNVSGTTFDTNWAVNPPQQLWKVPVGPGWSSFAVAGQLLFTQEQRGSMETVVCYDSGSGEELWARGVRVAF